MKVKILKKWEQIEIFVFPVVEDKFSVSKEVPFSKEIKRLRKDKIFSGKREEILFIPPDSRISFARLYIGLGKEKNLSPRRYFEIFGLAGKELKKKEYSNIGFTLPKNGENILENALQGIILGNYQFKKYKTEKFKKWKNVFFLSQNKFQDLRKRFNYSLKIIEGVEFTRDLINSPGNEITPLKLAKIARSLAKKNGYRIKVFDEKEIRKKGMNAFYGVGQGSDNPPRFIHLVYSPPDKVRKKIVLIGKGLTFDSGGLSLKTSKGMVGMKADKAGACAVLGLFSVLKDLNSVWRIPHQIHGIIPACENMPSSKAQRPDDVVEALNGRSIEIVSTDAEGRLTLADALSYASKLKPNIIVDLATLTGACVVALGEHTAGLFCEFPDLREKLLEASHLTGENIWHLPIDEKLKEKLKSPVADIKNSGGPYGGAILGALFLKEFVNPQIIWAHLDIAGPSYYSQPAGPYEGATGFGVRLFSYFLKCLSS